jgi:CheY-like chemotaxis protein
MYFIFVSNDSEAVQLFEYELLQADAKNVLLVLPNGYDLIRFLQEIQKGEPYPDLIILTPKFLRLGGMDLLELLKTDDLYRLIPVFMLLPEYNVDQEAVCNRLGTEYLPAPHNPAEWESAVNRMCAVCS